MRSAMEARSLSQTDLAKEIGLSQGAIGQILSGVTTRSRYLPQIARVLGVSVEWLLGETNDPSPGVGRAEDMAEELGLVGLTQTDIGYGLGGGSYLEGPVEHNVRYFPLDWLRQITPSPPSMLFIADGIGDSMVPTLMDSDTLIIDRAQNRVNMQDRIWALAYGELGMVKRVRRLPSGMFLIISDNPAISDFEAHESEMHIVGRLVWIGRKA